MIQIEQLTFQYQNSSKPVLQGIDLQIEEGEFIGIIGNSGAGKSTLTYALNGVIPHHFTGDFYGSVTVEGMDTVTVRPEELSRFVGSVFQDIDGQMVASVVEDEILFGLENFGIPKEEIPVRLNEALETIGITNLRYRTLASLSGGQKQKVAIASILALKPKILLLDEPTGELDPYSSRQIFELLRVLNREHHITVLIVEQKIMLLCEFASRLLVLNHGEIRFDGLTGEVLQHYQELEQLGINVPRVATLATLLQEKGLYHGALPMNLEQAEQMVREVLAQ